MGPALLASAARLDRIVDRPSGLVLSSARESGAAVRHCSEPCVPSTRMFHLGTLRNGASRSMRLWSVGPFDMGRRTEPVAFGIDDAIGSTSRLLDHLVGLR